MQLLIVFMAGEVKPFSATPPGKPETRANTAPEPSFSGPSQGGASVQPRAVLAWRPVNDGAVYPCGIRPVTGPKRAATPNQRATAANP